LVPAARKVFTGAERVTRILTAGAHHFREQLRMSPLLVNGALGLIVEAPGSLAVMSFTVDEDRITEIDAVLNPEKLRTLVGTRASMAQP
jgi:RNA polymerase sigma-70 factor (ECF subfamily)